MGVLVVACKGCGAPLPTGIRTGWVKTPVMGPHHLRCTVCGFAADYRSAEFVASVA